MALTLAILVSLEFQGVPATAVRTIEASTSSMFGSLAEARSMSAVLPKRVQRVVVVTSAPHTSQPAMLSPQLTPDVMPQVYAGSALIHSPELSAPIWMEYVKFGDWQFAGDETATIKETDSLFGGSDERDSMGLFGHYATVSEHGIRLPNAEAKAIEFLSSEAPGKRVWVVVQSGRSGLPVKLRDWLGRHSSHELQVRQRRFDYAEYTVDVYLLLKGEHN